MQAGRARAVGVGEAVGPREGWVPPRAAAWAGSPLEGSASPGFQGLCSLKC